MLTVRQRTDRLATPGHADASPQPNESTIVKTDLQLQQDVLAELKWEPSVNAAHIGVKVKDGIVTLAGHADRFAEKHHAEEAAICWLPHRPARGKPII